MYKELVALKVEAEHEILYAKAKIEVVDKLMAKLHPVSPIEEEVATDEETVEDDTELESV